MLHLFPVLTILTLVGALACFWAFRLRRRLPDKVTYAFRHARHLKGGMLCCHVCGEINTIVDARRSTGSYQVHACARCGMSLWREKAAS